jgi:hypothetical protein
MYTWQHITLTRDIPLSNSNKQSQQASGQRPTPQTAQPLRCSCNTQAIHCYWKTIAITTTHFRNTNNFIWYDTIRYDTIRCDAMRRDAIGWYDIIYDMIYMIWYDMIWYLIWYMILYDIWYISNHNWFDTRWQQYITHLHTNNAHNTKKENAGRAPSLRVILWYLPYNWGKSTGKPQLE